MSHRKLRIEKYALLSCRQKPTSILFSSVRLTQSLLPGLFKYLTRGGVFLSPVNEGVGMFICMMAFSDTSFAAISASNPVGGFNLSSGVCD